MSKIRKIFGDDLQPDETIVFLETEGEPTDVSTTDAGEIDGTQPVVTDGASGEKDVISLDREGSDRIRDRVTRSLVASDIAPARIAQDCLNEWRRRGEKGALWRVVARHPSVAREAVYEEAARMYAFRTADISPESFDKGFAQRVIESFSEEQRDAFVEHRVVPLSYEADTDRDTLKLVLAANDPTHPELQRFVHSLDLESFEVCYAPEDKIFPVLEQLFPRKNEYLDRIRADRSAEALDIGATFDEGSTDLVDEEALDAEINRSALINLVEGALVDAVRQGASDIHIYPNAEKHTEFHFRIDGELQLWNTQSKVSPEAMIAVAKDRCGNIDRFEREAAQDGYIQRSVDGALIRYRVSVLPIATANRDIKAESVVIRVLDDRKVFRDLGSIGLLSGALERYRQSIRKPHGMVIMTGPTGSGKSTTLVAALQEIVKPQINVLTVEDPVEYIIPGVRQIKLGPRLELEHALRSILRHDPDIVMVGEMRDRVTAELAIKLANTGHLTFSTLHTNDAPSAVSRLFKMGIEPFLLAYAINLVVAQRLLRKLCPTCKRIDRNPDEVLLAEVGFSEQEMEETTFYEPAYDQSCPNCRGLGYRGRRAIGEALYFSRGIRHRIVSSGSTIDEDAVRRLAIEEGMLTLVASAREVVKLGESSIEEIIRVTASEE